MIRAIATTMVFLMCVIAHAADKAILESKPEYSRDSKVVIRVKGADAEKVRIKWWVRSNEGKASPDNEVIDNGKAVAVWAPPGKYEVLVTIAIPDEKSVTFVDAECKFTILASSDPLPTPGPGPVPVPDPVTPPQNVFGDVDKVVSDLIAPVRDDDKAGGCKIIAAAYRKHGELASKGEYSDQNLLADATSSEFVYELGLNRYIRYRPAMTRLRSHMEQLIKDGKLKDKNMKQWSELWAAYASAFDKAVK